MVTTPAISSGPIDCACLIHGTAYEWKYVEHLYNMLNRHLTAGARLHVYTESHRPVPAHMIKHELQDWGISEPKRSWWYKMQLFNPEHHNGPLLYFDLDTVIVNNIDWICNLPSNFFWSVRDFKYLWRSSDCKVNSSVMWWNTGRFDMVWHSFQRQNLKKMMSKYHGDQDYINDAVGHADRRFFDVNQVKSWRWQCLDGGYNFNKKFYKYPGKGTNFDPPTSVLIFHGKPKPGDLTDPVIVQHWQ